ncbi:MAG: EvpB/VC tail sheath N-terminal domain [Pseudomonadota bacterium]
MSEHGEPTNICGIEAGGRASGLHDEGAVTAVPLVEVALVDAQWLSLSSAGLLPLLQSRGLDDAALVTTSSLHVPGPSDD